jgi:hypothetical protein
MSSVFDWLPVILADFAGTPVADVDVRLIEVDSAHPGEFAWLIRESAGRPRHLMLKVDGGLTGLDWLALDSEGLAVEIASALQDYVMDNLNTTWPEVIADGRLAVLEPRLGPDGMPRWEGRGVEPCPFGQLAARLA